MVDYRLWRQIQPGSRPARRRRALGFVPQGSRDQKKIMGSDLRLGQVHLTLPRSTFEYSE